jgi:hypothetical protein
MIFVDAFTILIFFCLQMILWCITVPVNNTEYCKLLWSDDSMQNWSLDNIMKLSISESI